MIAYGDVTNVYITPSGSELVADAAIGATTLFVTDAYPFSSTGGTLVLNGVQMTYTAVDYDLNTITVPALAAAAVTDDEVSVYPAGSTKFAMIDPDDGDEGFRAIIPYSMVAQFDDGMREEWEKESVLCSDETGRWEVKSVDEQIPIVRGTYIDAVGLPGGSDGSPPASSPTPNVLAGIGSLFITWTPLSNSDVVTYDVYLYTVSGTALSPAVLLASTQGALVNTTKLPNGTALVNGTTYYSKIVARDLDGSAAASAEGSGSPLAGADPTTLTNNVTNISNLQAKFPITGGDITNGTITTSKIGNLQITNALIADATILTAKYGAGSVTNTVIADDSVTSAKIVANTIVAADIAANTITASQIAAATITGDRLVANTITAVQIAAATITANELASGSVTTNKLAVIIGGGNLLNNSGFENTTTPDSGWTRNNGTGTLTVSAQTTTKVFGSQSVQLVGNTTGSDTFITQQITVLPNTTYTFSAWRYVPSAITGGANGNRSIYIRDGSGVGTALTTTLAVGVTTGVWVRESVTMTTQASTTFVQVRLYAPNGTVYWDGAQLEVGDVPTGWAPKADEILPGTVVASMIAASTITSNEIAANTITGAKIAALTIAAGNLVANTITAGQIAANTITASQIAANTITAAQIAANTITAAQIAAGTITTTQLTANAIDGMTITGAVFQTATSGQRMTMQNDTSAGVIKFYSGLSSDVAGYLNPDINVVGTASIPTVTMKTPTGGGFNVAPFMFLRAGGHTATVDSATQVYLAIPDSLAGSGATLGGSVIIGKDPAGFTALTIKNDGTVSGNGPWQNTSNNISGLKLFAITPDTTTGSANTIWVAGGQYKTVSSLTKHKIDPKPISIERVKKLLEVPLVDWYDRAEVEENGGKRRGLRRIPGVLAEDVNKAEPLFNTYLEGNLQGVAYDRIGVAMMPLIKDLYEEVASLKRELARVSG